MNYYPHHIGDYGSATAHLSMLEDAAYRRLLDWYYQTEQPLPADPRTIYRRVRAASEDERAAVDNVLAEFFVLDGGTYRHKRCDAEIQRARDKRSKARDSAEMRWQKAAASERNANASTKDANASRTACEGNAPNSQEPIANSQEPKRGGESARGARIPANFPDDDAKRWSMERRPDLDAELVAEGFRDYWLAKAGRDGLKADWPATWRQWVRRQDAPPKRAQPPPARAAPTRFDRQADIIRQLTTSDPEPIDG